MIGRRSRVLLSVLVAAGSTCTPARPHQLVARPALRPATLTSKPASSLLMAASEAEPVGLARSASAAWGVCGFLSILASAIRRLGPIALQPFANRDLSLLQCWLYVGSVVGFAYIEGYGAFQKKFSPMVVRRAMTLSRAGAATAHRALAPFYSMGLFHASRKRKIVSWSVSVTVFLLVGVVKRLPYPWRSIVDAGVCSGLCWGGASIVVYYIRALFGMPPAVDPELP